MRNFYSYWTLGNREKTKRSWFLIFYERKRRRKSKRYVSVPILIKLGVLFNVVNGDNLHTGNANAIHPNSSYEFDDKWKNKS